MSELHPAEIIGKILGWPGILGTPGIAWFNDLMLGHALRVGQERLACDLWLSVSFQGTEWRALVAQCGVALVSDRGPTPLAALAALLGAHRELFAEKQPEKRAESAQAVAADTKPCGTCVAGNALDARLGFLEMRLAAVERFLDAVAGNAVEKTIVPPPAPPRRCRTCADDAGPATQEPCLSCPPAVADPSEHKNWRPKPTSAQRADAAEQVERDRLHAWLWSKKP